LIARETGVAAAGISPVSSAFLGRLEGGSRHGKVQARRGARRKGQPAPARIEDAPSAYVSLRLEAAKKHKTGSGEKKQG
jgi:hypothetical protein